MNFIFYSSFRFTDKIYISLPSHRQPHLPAPTPRHDRQPVPQYISVIRDEPTLTPPYHAKSLVYIRFTLGVVQFVCVPSRSVMSDSLQPHGLYPARLLCPWNSPDKSTGVSSHSLLQGIFQTQGSNPGFLHCRQILFFFFAGRFFSVWATGETPWWLV